MIRSPFGATIRGSNNDKKTFWWGSRMTGDAARAAIKKMIEEHTKEVTADKKTARDSLIKEGIYTRDGKLAEQYGGK